MFFFQAKTNHSDAFYTELHLINPVQMPSVDGNLPLAGKKGVIKGQCYQKIRLLANCRVLQMISRFFHASLTFCEGLLYDSSYKFTQFDRDSRRFNKLPW
jgi:hypothetical protein